jgi:hypothetical protein
MTEIIIHTPADRQRAMKAVEAIRKEPVMSVTIKPYRKKRSNGQNRLQWVSLVADYSMQVEIEGRKFLPDVWHEQLKKQFLPEAFDDELTMPGYKKWEEMPDGSLKMVGSTTKLTKLGMEAYLNECYAYGAGELGIRFTANKNHD